MGLGCLKGMANEILLKRQKIVECYFAEKKDAYYVYYVEANIGLFSSSYGDKCPDYSYWDESYRVTYVCLFDSYGRAKTSDDTLFNGSIADYDENPHDEETDVRRFLQWSMTRVITECNIRTRLSKFWGGLSLAMFTYEDDNSVSFDCLPFVFPCSKLSLDQAFLRRVKTNG